MDWADRRYVVLKDFELKDKNIINEILKENDNFITEYKTGDFISFMDYQLLVYYATNEAIELIYNVQEISQDFKKMYNLENYGWLDGIHEYNYLNWTKTLKKLWDSDLGSEDLGINFTISVDYKSSHNTRTITPKNRFELAIFFSDGKWSILLYSEYHKIQTKKRKSFDEKIDENGKNICPMGIIINNHYTNFDKMIKDIDSNIRSIVSYPERESYKIQLELFNH